MGGESVWGGGGWGVQLSALVVLFDLHAFFSNCVEAYCTTKCNVWSFCSKMYLEWAWVCGISPS